MIRVELQTIGEMLPAGLRRTRQRFLVLLRAGAAAILALPGAGCNRASEASFDEVPARSVSIAHLKSLCEGEMRTITEQIAVCGVVTGNDRYGEFPREVVLQDASGGITVAADYPALMNPYPLGRELTVYCNGLTLYDHGGTIRLGKLPPDDAAGWDAATRRCIPEEELARHLRLTESEASRPEPRAIGIGDLGPALADVYISIDGVRFAQSGYWCDTDPATGRSVATEHALTDAQGHPLPLTVRTPGTVFYASEPLPEGCGSLCGILDCFGGAWSLRITAFETAFVTAAATSPTTGP